MRQDGGMTRRRMRRCPHAPHAPPATTTHIQEVLLRLEAECARHYLLVRVVVAQVVVVKHAHDRHAAAKHRRVLGVRQLLLVRRLHLVERRRLVRVAPSRVVSVHDVAQPRKHRWRALHYVVPQRLALVLPGARTKRDSHAPRVQPRGRCRYGRHRKPTRRREEEDRDESHALHRCQGLKV